MTFFRCLSLSPRNLTKLSILTASPWKRLPFTAENRSSAIIPEIAFLKRLCAHYNHISLPELPRLLWGNDGDELTEGRMAIMFLSFWFLRYRLRDLDNSELLSENCFDHKIIMVTSTGSFCGYWASSNDKNFLILLAQIPLPPLHSFGQLLLFWTSQQFVQSPLIWAMPKRMISFVWWRLWVSCSTLFETKYDSN